MLPVNHTNETTNQNVANMTFAFSFGTSYITITYLFVETATQLLILPPHIPLIGQGGITLLLRYSMICAVASPFLTLNSPTFHSTTPHHINRARRHYTVVSLFYDMCSGLAIFDFKLTYLSFFHPTSH